MNPRQSKRDILCFDLKSFYASVECAMRGLDPFKTPLVVADPGRGGGSIILAVSPFLKAQGIPGRLRVFELPRVPHLIMAKPRMKEYLRVSSDIIAIYLRFVSAEDLHIYSVDEAFLDVTDYLTYYGCDAHTLAQRIKKTILEETKIPATCGIGDNLLLSKLALDLESKTAATGIAEWRVGDVPTKVWPITPLSSFWGIGHRMEKRLNQLGLFSIGDIAKADRKVLKRQFGILGEELYFHAHGIDESRICEKHQDIRPMKSVGVGQTLFRDYHGSDVFVVLLEMADEVAERLRYVHQEARVIHFAVGYSKAYGGGFSRQLSLPFPTSDPEIILMACLDLMAQHYLDLPIRRLSIRATQLSLYQPFEQMTLFDARHEKAKRHALYTAIDRVKARFGKQSVLRLSSYFDEGTARLRSTLIGGHHG